MATKITEAAAAYIALRDRTSNPAGKFDGGGRFTLDTYHSCCSGIRGPSRAYPYSEMVHGRTLLHVATAAGVDATELRRAVKLITKAD